MKQTAIIHTILGFFATITIATSPLQAASESGEGLNTGEMIMHHILDEHEWHFATWGNTDITLPLPVILYHEEEGLSVFLSNKFHNPEQTHNGYQLDHGEIVALDGGAVYDFSITKNVFAMFLSALLLLWLFGTAARAYRDRGVDTAPKGLQGFIEPLVVFVRDEVARPMVGPKYRAYLPFLLTVFFFIWLNNLMGLLPGGANVTGNITVTMVLALFTFLIVNFSGNRNYWNHIFNTPGVPWWLKWGVPIMPLIEFIGIFTKPFALMIRLFANMTGGHMIILSIISMIFIFSEMHPAAGAGMSLISVLFALFMYGVKLLVAALQAYIFTILSALFIGEAVAESH